MGERVVDIPHSQGPTSLARYLGTFCFQLQRFCLNVHHAVSFVLMRLTLNVLFVGYQLELLYSMALSQC